MRKLLLIMAMMFVSFIAFTSCGSQKTAQQNILNSVHINRVPQQTYNNLKTGLKVNVVPTRPTEEMTGWTHHLSGKTFFASPTINYIRAMGFKQMSNSSDYTLTITLKRVDVDGYKGNAWADLEISLTDSKGEELFSQNNISATSQAMIILQSLNEAYTSALEQIDWNRIASYLKTEPKGKYKVINNTDLAQTIIRWDIQSRPQGADIFWRVVSKAPEVKSTNNKYLQTTPYEATKALDIKGLTYENSSNVRVILRCEKDGYLSQEKEYDVRMIMDQEEISAFFRLVKEETE